VCIAHYRGQDLLATCIDSLLAQDCDFEFEIIVHDDASNDGSLEFLSREYTQVEVLASAENVGFCIANNRMVDHARGKFVLLLNNDAALFTDALSTLADGSTQWPSDILTLPQYDWESGGLVDRGCLLDPFYNPVPNLDPDRAEVAMVIGACLWIERSQWIRLGGFPEWLESVGEDLYLCCAARLASLSVRALRESGYRHRQGHSFGGNKPSEGRLASSYRRRRLSERNKTMVLFIMTPTILMWPLLALHLTTLSVEGILVSLVRRDGRILTQVYVNVFAALLDNWHSLEHYRKDTQCCRRSSLGQYLRGYTFQFRKIIMLWRYGWPELK
jgi:GT2 family glycosyltransferase